MLRDRGNDSDDDADAEFDAEKNLDWTEESGSFL